MVNFRPQRVGPLRDALEHMPAHAPVHVHVSIPASGAMLRAPLLSVHTMPAAVELGGAIPPTERLDLEGRDPDAVTPIELLAFAYPDVFALLKRDDEIARMWESVSTVDQATGSRVRNMWPGLARALDKMAAETPPIRGRGQPQ